MACLFGLLRVLWPWWRNWLSSGRETGRRPRAAVESKPQDVDLACASPSCSALPLYELPWERERHIPEAYERTLDGCSSRSEEEDPSHRMTSPLRADLLVRPPSSSSCCTCSSDGDPLEGWGWHPREGSLSATSEDASGTTTDSTDESESHVPGASSRLDDHHLVEGKLEAPKGLLVVPERPPERERRVPRRRDVLGRLPEEAKPQALPPFAQLNVFENSAYGTENGIVWSVRSLEIQVGLPPAPAAVPSHVQRKVQEVEEQRPARLALRSVPEKATPGASPRTGQTPAPQQKRLVGSTCTPEDFDPEAFALNNMDEETRERLERHAKKKMARGWQGMPFVAIMSHRFFHAMEDYRLERGPQNPTPKSQLSPIQAVARNPLDGLSSPAKHLQRPPGNKASSLFHPVAPEKTKKLALSPPWVQLGRNRAAFHGPRKTVIFSFDSFERCRAPSPSRLPKFIHRGNKTPQPKDLSVAFVAGKALHLVDFNIRRKSQVSTWKLRPLHATPTVERTSVPGQPRDPKGGVFEGEAHVPSLPFLILKHRRGKALPASPGELPRRASSEKPPKLPPPPMSPGEEEALRRPRPQSCPPPLVTSALEPPLEPPGKDEAAAGRGDGRGGMEEASGLQLERVGTQCCTAPPPSEEKDVEPPEPPLEPPRRAEVEETQPQGDSSSSGVPSLALNTEGAAAAAAAAAAPGVEGEERLPGTNAFLPSSIQGKAEACKKGKRTRPEMERSQPFRRGAPPPFAQERAAAADGRKAGSRQERRRGGPPRPSSEQRRAERGQTRAKPKPGCIPWHSLCRCLVRSKEKAKQAMDRLVALLRRRPRQRREGP